MSHKNNTDTEKAFEAWLSEPGSQTPPDTERESDWHWRREMAQHLMHHAEVTPDEKVPAWDREATFESDKKPWWQWSGLPAMSFAFSLFAIGLVVFKVELVVQDSGVLLSFAGSHQKTQTQDIEQMIDNRLQQFANEQQVILANMTADLREKQQDSNLQLASYIMGASRQERKEDFTDFINYINDQRAEDKFDQNMQMKQIQQTLRMQNSNIKTLGLQAQPAEWSTEE